MLNIGERLLTYIRGFAGIGAITGFLITLFTRVQLIDTIVFLIVILLMSTGPIFLITVLYFWKPHRKFIVNLRVLLQKQGIRIDSISVNIVSTFTPMQIS
ncbi:MAG: hypothetical protein ACTSXJ_00625 [Candidatus Baldrarchaeia archaeon]